MNDRGIAEVNWSVDRVEQDSKPKTDLIDLIIGPSAVSKTDGV